MMVHILQSVNFLSNGMDVICVYGCDYDCDREFDDARAVCICVYCVCDGVSVYCVSVYHIIGVDNRGGCVDAYGNADSADATHVSDWNSRPEHHLQPPSGTTKRNDIHHEGHR